jgi:hypothetical protein
MSKAAVRHVDRGAALDEADAQRRFVRNLTEAIVWCTASGSLSNPETSLRTCEPTILISPEDQVRGVCSSRSMSLWHSGRRDLPAVTGLCGGRLVAYFPNDNLCDGVAKTHSKGFFDFDNIPPFDTWVWWVRNVRREEYDDHTTSEREVDYLVAWVPPDFVALADAGIRINAEDCIMWLDEVDDNFVRSLRSMNFLPDAPVGVSAPGV